MLPCLGTLERDHSEHTMLSVSLFLTQNPPPKPAVDAKPVRVEVVEPIRNASFNKNGKAKVRKQGGNPRTVEGMLLFDGSMDGIGRWIHKLP